MNIYWLSFELVTITHYPHSSSNTKAFTDNSKYIGFQRPRRNTATKCGHVHGRLNLSGTDRQTDGRTPDRCFTLTAVNAINVTSGRIYKTCIRAIMRSAHVIKNEKPKQSYQLAYPRRQRI